MFLTDEELEARWPDLSLLPDASTLESDELPMESSIHYTQLALLVACLEWLWRDKNDFFIGANLTVYFSLQQFKKRDLAGPDFFLVKNTEKKHRKSWAVWEEDGKYPDLIIELLSDSTAKTDRTRKKELYQDRFRTPEYFWFSPETGEFMGYHLVEQQYQEIPMNENGWRWSKVLELNLGVVEGQLRYLQPNGQLVPSPAEAAYQEMLLAQEIHQQTQQQIQQAQEQAQQAQQQAQEQVQQAQEQAQQQVQQAQEQAQQAQQEAQQAQQEAALAKVEAQKLKAQLRELGIESDP